MVGGAVAPLRINHASADPRFREHPGLLQHGIESYIAVPLIRRDGSYFGTLCTLDPQPAELTDADFEVFHLLSQLISFELEADEQQQRRAAEVRALEDVIAIAAHDLRQPLTILLGRAELLARKARRGASVDELVPGLDGIVAQARRSTQLSEALLDVAQIEMDGLSLSPSQVDLVDLARQILDDARTTMPARAFLLDAPPTIPLFADERRLGQVLRNLIENAAKYAPAESGPVILSAAVDATQDQPATVRICVRDHGPGVTPDDLDRLFQRQYRTPDAETRGVRGTGLGLYIVRQIIEAHAGHVRAENADGGGLQVCLELPQHVTSAP